MLNFATSSAIRLILLRACAAIPAGRQVRLSDYKDPKYPYPSLSQHSTSFWDNNTGSALSSHANPDQIHECVWQRVNAAQDHPPHVSRNVDANLGQHYSSLLQYEPAGSQTSSSAPWSMGEDEQCPSDVNQHPNSSGQSLGVTLSDEFVKQLHVDHQQNRVRSDTYALILSDSDPSTAMDNKTEQRDMTRYALKKKAKEEKVLNEGGSLEELQKKQRLLWKNRQARVREKKAQGQPPSLCKTGPEAEARRKERRREREKEGYARKREAEGKFVRVKMSDEERRYRRNKTKRDRRAAKKKEQTEVKQLSQSSATQSEAALDNSNTSFIEEDDSMFSMDGKGGEAQFEDRHVDELTVYRHMPLYSPGHTFDTHD